MSSANEDQEENCAKLSPHIIRLLKLVESAPTEHAREAAHLLGQICSTSSPQVMWEVLGKLTMFLSGKEVRLVFE